MSRLTWLVALSLAGACGASTAQVTRAKSVRYQADFTEVWRAVADEVKTQYPKIKVEDPEAGVITTDWAVIEKKAESMAEGSGSGDTPARGTRPSATSRTSSGITGGELNAADLFQARIKIVEGGPPWQIVIEGEAAEYRPGLASLRPYPRGAVDEPHWVQGRIDDLYLGIYKRLEGRAVDAGAAAPAPAPVSGSGKTPKS
jgi:hypothetical protein